MRRFLNLIDESPRESEEDFAINSSRREFLLYSAALSSLVALGSLPEVGLAATRSPAAIQLENQIDAYIKSLRRLGKLGRDESTAWSVYDFRTGRKLVAINEDIPLQSASMIKPFVALAFFYRASENGRRYRYDRRTRAIMEAMIRRSSNRATNQVMSLIARKPRDVERILKVNAPGVFRQTSIVERIPSNGRTYRNKASAHDYSRFLYGIWQDRFPFASEIKKLMGLPNRDRILHGARHIPRDTRVYDKTGSTAKLCGNMGILEARGRDGRRYPYTFIAIIQKSRRARNYALWINSRGNVIRKVSDMVYLDLKRRHNLV